MSSYQYFSYTLDPLSCISVGSGDEVRFLKRMQDIIRGSVIWGALGAAWWNAIDPGYSLIGDRTSRQKVFDDLFAKNLHVRQAVPFSDKQRGKAILRPVSAMFCKYQEKEECRDLIVADPALERGGLKQCPECGGILVSGKGWSVPEDWSSSITSTALTERGVSKNQNLFSREVFNPEIRLSGTLRLNVESPYYDLAENWIMMSRRISIGGRRSVLGRVRWNASKLDEPPFGVRTPTNSKSVALYIQSSAILVDRLGFPVVSLKKWLSDYPMHQGEVASMHQGEVVATWERPVTESGWHSIAGMPKPTEWALAAGSVALLHGWDVELLNVIGQGIGLRQNEGFGEVKLVESDA